MQESDFFRHPIGTGPYKLESWDVGQSIVLVKNENYYLGVFHIDRILFKIVPDDNAQAVQLKSGELDLALLDPKNAQNFQNTDGFTCYDMKTSDYRGFCSISGMNTGRKTGTSFPPCAMPLTGKPLSTRCCWVRA